MRVSGALLLVGAVLFLSGFSGCRKNWVIIPTVTISDDSNKMVFLAGPRTKEGSALLQPAQARPFILDLEGDNSRVVEIKQAKGAISVAWRPGSTPAELYLLVHDFYGVQPSRLMAFRMSNAASVILSQELPEGPLDIPEHVSWSPDGKTLVISGLVSGLQFSYDGGKTFVSSGIRITGPDRFVWKSGGEFYVRDADKILEIAIDDGQARISRTVASGKVRLGGILNGEAVYSMENNIYCGDKLFYESTQKMGWIFADDPYVAFQIDPRARDGYICVLDKEGNLVSKKQAATDTIIIGLSSKKKTVYLLNDLRAIQAYSLVGNDDISTLYRLW